MWDKTRQIFLDSIERTLAAVASPAMPDLTSLAALLPARRP